MTPSDEIPTALLPAGIHPALAAALERQGYVQLTPVQSAMLTPEADGRDLLVSAQTGSGKTVAFGIAIAPTLLSEHGFAAAPEQPSGLIIAPTRELALQVERELRWLYADTGAVTASCVGGMDMRKEIRQLERGAHIVVGTPGRLRDHITKGSLDLSALRAVVLDEADEMLDLGFREDLEFILAASPEERRTLLFSATVPKSIAQLAKTYQRDALRIVATAASERHADIDYQMVMVQPHERENAIINTLLYFDSGSAIVFCHTREAVKHLAARLRNRVCVTTNDTTHSINLPNLDLVIHADLPSNPDTLLHRSGRTGRAGRKGVCVLIVPLRRHAAASRVLKIANIDATTRTAPSAAEIDARYREQILSAALAAPPPEEAEAGFVAELLARMSPEQLAAAYLRQQLATRPAPEDISATPLPTGGKLPRTLGEGPRPKAERRDMTGSAWFTLSLGRRNHAEPKWVLPLICRAGGITRDDVGSIKIFDEETRFEISAGKADEFAAAIAQTGSLERGVTIASSGPRVQEPRWEPTAGEGAAEQRPREKSYKPHGKPEGFKKKPKDKREFWAAGPKPGKKGKPYKAKSKKT